MYEVVPSELYFSSLTDCAVYIKRELNSPTSAERLLDLAEQAAMSLANMPNRFPLSRYQSLALKGIRVLPVHNHCIFYSVDDAAQKVYLHLFGYAPRDWGSLF